MASIYVPQAVQEKDPLDTIARGLQIAGTIYGIKDAQDKNELLKQQVEQQKLNQKRLDEGVLLPKELAEYGKDYTISDKPSQGSLSFKQSAGQGQLKPIYLTPKDKEKNQKLNLGLQTATGLRQEFNQRQIVKDFNLIDSAYKKVLNASKQPSAAGDLSLIFGYMKILDPGSTVREGEFANAQNATGVDSQIKNIYNKILTGERLNPQQRADFVNQSSNLVSAQAEQLKKIEDEFGSLSRSYNVDPRLVYTPQSDKYLNKKDSKEDDSKSLALKALKKKQGLKAGL